MRLRGGVVLFSVAAAISACNAILGIDERVPRTDELAPEAGTDGTTTEDAPNGDIDGSSQTDGGPDAPVGPCAACDDKNVCTTDICADGGCDHEPVVCEDTNECTADTCDAVTGCKYTAITACVNADGCCPAGCTPANDTDCGTCTNIAPLATGASTGPAAFGTVYGPQNLNDGRLEGQPCEYSTVTNNNATPTGHFEYTWPAPVRVGSMMIFTPPDDGTCDPTTTHTVTSGSVQAWNGAKWITVTTFAGKTNDFSVKLAKPITTTKLRLVDPVPGSFNAFVFEWRVFSSIACP